MKYTTKLTFIFLVISAGLFSQSKNSSIEVKKQYQYSFNGELNSQNITNLENALSNLTFVTIAKVKYKTDSRKGEVILQTSERTVISESDKGFDVIELKKLLISKNLEPVELNITSL